MRPLLSVVTVALALLLEGPPLASAQFISGAGQCTTACTFTTSVTAPTITGTTSVTAPTITGTTSVTAPTITGTTSVTTPALSATSNVVTPNLFGTGALLLGINGVTGTWVLQTDGSLTPASTTYSLGRASTPLGKLYLDYTNTATVGAVTINKPTGRVNIGAGGTSVVVTNNLVTAASHVFAVASSADATARVLSVVPAAGSFTITTAATTAQTSFDFVVLNAD